MMLTEMELIINNDKKITQQNRKNIEKMMEENLGNIENNSVKEFESQYPVIAKEFKKIQWENYELLARKMLDYGPDNISLGGDLSIPENKNMSLTGVWIRVMDKMNRLKQLVVLNKKSHVNNEGIEDTYDDISNYSIIAKIVFRGKWRRGL